MAWPAAGPGRWGAGDVFVIETPGGGGYGAPEEAEEVAT